MRAFKDFIARSGSAAQVLVGLNGSNASIQFGSAGDAIIERTGTDVLALATGDKLQQAKSPTEANDMTNLINTIFWS